MPDRLYRLMERHQRLDEVLRLLAARPSSHPLEILRLKLVEQAIKRRISRLIARPFTAAIIR